MPPTSLLDAGRNTKRYFRKVPSNLGDFHWKIPWCWCDSTRVKGLPLENAGRNTILKPKERVMVVVGWSPLNVLECLNSSREIFWKLQAPIMSMKSVFFKRLPFQMCVSGLVKAPKCYWSSVSDVVLVLPISAKLLACSQIGHLVGPYFFLALRSYFVCFFRGVRGGKILHQTDQIINTFMLQEELKLPEGAEGASWRVQLHWTSM